MTIRWKQSLIAAFVSVLAPGAVRAADFLKWNSAGDKVDALVETWTVPELLQRVAGATGWEIYVDPRITNRISARFSEKPPGDALRRLLGNYNFALVPETNSPSKLFVFRNSREEATRAVQAVAQNKAKTAKKALIGNELVVTLKPGEKIEDLAKRLGAKIVGRADGQNSYRLRFDDEKSAQTARTAAESDDAVDSVDNNYYVSRPETPQALGTPGGALGLSPKASPDGKYTVVGLVDSALQPKESNLSGFLVPGADSAETKSGGEPTHGTMMAENIFAAIAANSEDKSTTVRLLPVNVFTEGGEQTTTYDIAVGIYKAVNGGAMIVNLSLGGEGDSTFLHNTIKSAHDQGVVFLAAAGNEPVSTPTYPAAYSEVIAVTASDRSGKLASYANRGDFVDVVAPGGNIITYQGQQYFVVGTSTSTALTTGIAAAYAERTRATGKPLETGVLQALAPKK
jgi:hypothetical protein